MAEKLVRDWEQCFGGWRWCLLRQLRHSSYQVKFFGSSHVKPIMDGSLRQGVGGLAEDVATVTCSLPLSLFCLCAFHLFCWHIMAILPTCLLQSSLVTLGKKKKPSVACRAHDTASTEKPSTHVSAPTSSCPVAL